VAFYLKKTKLKGRTYLSIDESFYSPKKKGTAHRCFKSLGSVETLMENGMEDPIAHFQQEVDRLNQERANKGRKQISDVSPLLYLGYFPLANILAKLKIKKYVDYFKLTNDFKFDLYELLAGLIFARAVNPCSKYRTFHEVLPLLYEKQDLSYDQLLDGLAFLGENYQKFIEIFTVATVAVYGLDTSNTYFDGTNFYFEIDREDDFRKKGPSKENQRTPIVGLGLLLDKNQIPIDMRMYNGNESEKPVLRNVLEDLRQQNNISGRTVVVADKGLNCAQNIAFAKQNGHGYIFSKSVKGLPEKELAWVLLPDGFRAVKNGRGQTLYFYKSCVDEFPYTFEHEGRNITVRLREKRLVVYNPVSAAKKRHEINRMVEKAHRLTLSGAKRNSFGEAGKYIKYTGGDGGKAVISINQENIEADLRLAGYNLLVTSEVRMSDRDIYETYHNLWRIEESFKIMKSDLDARPVFLQKRETIQGHFLICYLTVLLERIFQFKVLENEFSTEEIFEFIRKFRVVKSEHRYINLATNSNFIRSLADKFRLPLTSYYLTESQIKSLLKHKI